MTENIHDESVSDSQSILNEEEETREAIAKRETSFVRCMRLLVLSVLVSSTILVAFAVFFFLRSAEQRHFDEAFNYDANKVLDAIGGGIDLTLTAVDSLVVTMVSFARFSNSTWPFVTVPDFELRAAKTRILSKSVIISQYLVVEKHQRTDWEAYAAENNAWVNESISMQEKDSNFHGPIVRDFYVVDEIHDYDEESVPEKNWYLPTWQASPAIPLSAIYNWDLLDYQPNVSAVAVFETHKCVLAESYHLPDPEDEEAVADNELDVEWFADYVKPGQDAGEPIFDVYYPILKGIDQIAIDNPKLYPLAGILAISIFWRELVENILPIGSNGVLIVFDNPCNPSFTFEINGPEVKYLGRGDLHDTHYDEYMVSSALLDLDSFQSSYSGVELEREKCQHSFRIYPSDDYQDSHITSQPVILTLVAICIFLFTSGVFVLYDQLVEYRQKTVLKEANKTSKIVSELFPSNVHDRLFSENGEETEDNKRRLWDESEMMSSFFQGSELFAQDSDCKKTPPIADLFPATTIFFADLAGFTKWSSQRTPTEVFELLEDLYGSFDKIARRRKVFKVETIGDCYVAVTGLPRPQEQHAVILVKFARDCILKMSQRTNQLADKLGADTRDLEMRVGLHSGPCTAGVLRGDKGRFQLFGDTVNVASRMESNGVKGRIHVSQSTADELLAKGKGHWLTPREDKIIAKGKGEMQTYFVSTTLGGATGIDGTSNLSDDSTTKDMTECPVSPSRLLGDLNAIHKECHSVEQIPADRIQLIERLLSERNNRYSKPGSILD